MFFCNFNFFRILDQMKAFGDNVHLQAVLVQLRDMYDVKEAKVGK